MEKCVPAIEPIQVWVKLALDLGHELRRPPEKDSCQILVRRPIRIDIILENGFVITLVDRYVVVDPDLVIRDVKQLAFENESVLLVICLGPDGVVVVLLSVVHLGPIAEILLNEPLVVPCHVLPFLRYVAMVSEFL